MSKLAVVIVLAIFLSTASLTSLASAQGYSFCACYDENGQIVYGTPIVSSDGSISFCSCSSTPNPEQQNPPPNPPQQNPPPKQNPNPAHPPSPPKQKRYPTPHPHPPKRHHKPTPRPPKQNPPPPSPPKQNPPPPPKQNPPPPAPPTEQNLPPPPCQPSSPDSLILKCSERFVGVLQCFIRGGMFDDNCCRQLRDMDRNCINAHMYSSENYAIMGSIINSLCWNRVGR